MTVPMLYGQTITCPLEVAGNDAWAGNCEELVRQGAADTARRHGARPDPEPTWIGWILDVWGYDEQGEPHPNPFKSRRLTGRPTSTDLPWLETGEVATFLVSAEVAGRPDPLQRLANGLLALTWWRAKAEYGVTV